jgi:hypothetical protein
MHINNFVERNTVNEPSVTAEEYSGFVRDFVGHASGRFGLKTGIQAVSEQLGIHPNRIFNWFYNRITHIDPREEQEYHRRKCEYLHMRAVELETRSKEAWKELCDFQRKVREAEQSSTEGKTGRVECVDSNSDGFSVDRGSRPQPRYQRAASDGRRR